MYLVPDSLRSTKSSFQINQRFQIGHNHRYLGQVLTLALVILNRVKFFDIDKLIVFVGTVFIPHLQVEQNNNPSSPLEVWKRSEYTDSSKVEGASNGNVLLNYHCETRLHHDLKTHLMGDCKFVVELCIKETVHYANPNPVQVPNLELRLVLIDQVLESKAKGVQDKKRKLMTYTSSASGQGPICLRFLFLPSESFLNSLQQWIHDRSFFIFLNQTLIYIANLQPSRKLPR